MSGRGFGQRSRRLLRGTEYPVVPTGAGQCIDCRHVCGWPEPLGAFRLIHILALHSIQLLGTISGARNGLCAVVNVEAYACLCE